MLCSQESTAQKVELQTALCLLWECFFLRVLYTVQLGIAAVTEMNRIVPDSGSCYISFAGSE